MVKTCGNSTPWEWGPACGARRLNSGRGPGLRRAGRVAVGSQEQETEHERWQPAQEEHKAMPGFVRGVWDQAGYQSDDSPPTTADGVKAH